MHAWPAARLNAKTGCGRRSRTHSCGADDDCVGWLLRSGIWRERTSSPFVSTAWHSRLALISSRLVSLSLVSRQLSSAAARSTSAARTSRHSIRRLPLLRVDASIRSSSSWSRISCPVELSHRVARAAPVVSAAGHAALGTGPLSCHELLAFTHLSAAQLTSATQPPAPAPQCFLLPSPLSTLSTASSTSPVSVLSPRPPAPLRSAAPASSAHRPLDCLMPPQPPATASRCLATTNAAARARRDDAVELLASSLSLRCR